MITIARPGWRTALITLLAWLIAACSGVPVQPPAPVEERPDYTDIATPPPPEPPPKPGEPDTRAAYQPLLDRADQLREKGDFEQALALLERALRIDADNAQVYLELARTHRARGDYAQARATAERGLLYCRGRAQCNALRDLAD